MTTAIKVFNAKTELVPEGSHHYYKCTFEDQGVAIQLAAFLSIEAWLHDVDTGVVINARSAVNLLNTNDGVLVAGAGGVAEFTWNLTDLDAKIVTSTKSVEEHRITWRITYARAGLTPGTLTHKAIYTVVNLEAITS